MEINVCTPTRGRLRFAGSTLFLSVIGRPVAGSFRGLDCAMKPHKLRPHGLILIFAPSLASQVPTGEETPVSPLAMKAIEESATNNSFFMGAPKVEYCETRSSRMDRLAKRRAIRIAQSEAVAKAELLRCVVRFA